MIETKAMEKEVDKVINLCGELLPILESRHLLLYTQRKIIEKSTLFEPTEKNQNMLNYISENENFNINIDEKYNKIVSTGNQTLNWIAESTLDGNTKQSFYNNVSSALNIIYSSMEKIKDEFQKIQYYYELNSIDFS